jgi:hypothetical protein
MARGRFIDRRVGGRVRCGHGSGHLSSMPSHIDYKY